MPETLSVSHVTADSPRQEWNLVLRSTTKGLLWLNFLFKLKVSKLLKITKKSSNVFKGDSSMESVYKPWPQYSSGCVQSGPEDCREPEDGHVAGVWRPDWRYDSA